MFFLLLKFTIFFETRMKTEFYDIEKLVVQTYVPFASTITDDDIRESLQNFNFVNKRLIYNLDLLFNVQSKRKFHKRKIATIVNEILGGKYDYNFAIKLWQDEEGYIDFDDYAMYHVRAFHYCNQNIPAQIIKQN